MLLWLDDLRVPPNSQWIWVKSVTAAIKLMKTGQIEHASLDHDLGKNRLSGYDFVKWMERHDVWPESIAIHSQNPVGCKNMWLAITRHYGCE